MPGKITLTAVKGPMEGDVFNFGEDGDFAFGRDRTCDHVMPGNDKKVARRQFQIAVRLPTARLRDLESTNGTYVNGVKYGKGCPNLEAGLYQDDIIQTGETELAVQILRPCPACHDCLVPGPTRGEKTHGSRARCPRCKSGRTDDDHPWPEDTIPDEIAGYTLGKRLGEGAMGVVYLVRKEGDDRQYAMKLLLAGHTSEKDRLLLLKEAIVLRRIEHDNCVRYYGLGEDRKLFYCVMEYCPGGSLFQFVKKRGGRLPLAEAARVALDALAGLACVHEENVVHRDVKPDNILLAEPEGGMAKITDFGLARCPDLRLTQTGDVGGNAFFVPREQITSFRNVTCAADVWGLGATFYWMLTGTPPRDFKQGEDEIEVVMTRPAVPIRKRDPKIPAKVADVLDRALSDQVRERYPHAGAFREALEKALRRG